METPEGHHQDHKGLGLLQGWRQEFSNGGLTLPTSWLKYGFQGTINARNLRKNRVSPSDGGLACSDGGLYPLAFSWRHPWALKSHPSPNLVGYITDKEIFAPFWIFSTNISIAIRSAVTKRETCTTSR